MTSQTQIKENIKAPRYWPYVRGIHRWPVNSPHKWPVTRKMSLSDDVIMNEYGIHHTLVASGLLLCLQGQWAWLDGHQSRSIQICTYCTNLEIVSHEHVMTWYAFHIAGRSIGDPWFLSQKSSIRQRFVLFVSLYKLLNKQWRKVGLMGA